MMETIEWRRQAAELRAKQRFESTTGGLKGLYSSETIFLKCAIGNVKERAFVLAG